MNRGREYGKTDIVRPLSTGLVLLLTLPLCTVYRIVKADQPEGVVPVSGSARMSWPSSLVWRHLLPRPACCCCWMAGLVLGRACPLYSCTASSCLCLGTRRLCACEGEFAYCTAGTQLRKSFEAITPCTDCCMHAWPKPCNSSYLSSCGPWVNHCHAAALGWTTVPAQGASAVCGLQVNGADKHGKLLLHHLEKCDVVLPLSTQAVSRVLCC